MQDEKQFEQLMLQYNQLKNGALDIRRMIQNDVKNGIKICPKIQNNFTFERRPQDLQACARQAS